ncbi:winged helix-turn-helix transcriptional regulator [Paenibacillus mesophilus]|uniref:MarR family winged helix-turn-helix transcriptional regulator n=1 Tax=Paenibacillus mesophilus TaxID=2582849 RepID=UPI00110DCCAB|nr:MarR family winged helix-turn-helix transcriptional regulator [Paenibacillus mesophilus]TMV43977.1 winged helix-turn-helix transcriptional regulator [Paenibacillus mesophilus]
MDKVTEQELSAWRFFIKAHAMIIERIEQDLAEQKRVPLTAYDVLIALFEAPGRKLRFGDLNKKLVLSKSGLTRLVDRMEREGLIRRERSEEDRRGAYAALTELGETELRKAWPVYAKGIKQYFAAPLSAGNDLQSARNAFEALYVYMQSQEGASS